MPGRPSSSVTFSNTYTRPALDAVPSRSRTSGRAAAQSTLLRNRSAANPIACRTASRRVSASSACLRAVTSSRTPCHIIGCPSASRSSSASSRTHDASVATEEAVFGREGLAGPVRPLRELHDAVAVIGVQMVDPELRIPQPRARREAEQPFVLRADVQRGAHVVDRVLVDDDRELFDQGSVGGLGLLEELLCDLALGDVEHHALVQRMAVVIASDGDRLVADPELTTVARVHPILRSEGALALFARRPFGPDTLEVVLVHDLGPQQGISELVRRIAEQLLDLRADE